MKQPFPEVTRVPLKRLVEKSRHLIRVAAVDPTNDSSEKSRDAHDRLLNLPH